MDLYSSRMSGADAVEAALFHNLDNDLAEVMKFCQGHLRDLVAIYVERFDYEKAKTVLRAVNGGASDEMIEAQILPSENPRNAVWLNIIRNTEGLEEAVEAMIGTPVQFIPEAGKKIFVSKTTSFLEFIFDDLGTINTSLKFNFFCIFGFLYFLASLTILAPAN